jgi:hypothetical protein
MASAVEDVIRRVWADLLDVAVVDGDDFFCVGGDSLSAARCCSRLSKALAADIPQMLLFEYPELTEFSAKVAELVREKTTPGPRSSG